MITNEQLKTFCLVCVGRRDYYWKYGPHPFLVYDKPGIPVFLTDTEIKKHLEGSITIGLSPFLDNENVYFGGIDLDVHGPTKKEKENKIKEIGQEAADKWEKELLDKLRDRVKEDKKKIEKELEKRGILHYFNSSGSDGEHLRVYPNKPTNAKVMRYFLLDFQEKVLGEIRHEVFPKQDMLDERTPFGNQMKAVLAIHPKTKKRAGIIKNGEVLNVEDSLKFLEEFAKQIPKAKPISFNITETIEQKYKKKKLSSEEIAKISGVGVPNYCAGFEEVACNQFLPSGKLTRHDYLDGNAYQYFNDKPELFKDYCELQGRDHTAFNNCEDWNYSCITIHKYLRNNEGEGINQWKEFCKSCPHYNKMFLPDLQPLIDCTDLDKRNRIIKDILNTRKNNQPIDRNTIIEQISMITGMSEEMLNEQIDYERRKQYEAQRALEIQERAATTSPEDMAFRNLVAEVLTLKAMKKNREAEELIVDAIVEKHDILTLRDDENSEMHIYEETEGVYRPNAKTYIKEFTRNILSEAYTPQFGNNIIAKLETDTYINPEKFFSEIFIHDLVVKNGILDIRTKELKPFTPEQIHHIKIPVTYEKSKDCPNIKKHFEEVLKNKEDVQVTQEIFGYLLLKRYDFAKSFLFIGNGRNGKSITLSIMKRFIGAENCSNIPLQQFETDSFAMGEVHNKLANMAGDINKTALRDTGYLKTLTGRDLISAQRKFLSRIKFENFAKMIFCTNEVPITYDLTLAFFNRWVLIIFPYTFLTQDEITKLPKNARIDVKAADVNIIDKLTSDDELSGLLNWALEGLARLLNQGGFSYSKTTDETKTLWMRKSSSFNAFMLDCIEEDAEGKIVKTELRKAYTKYCKEHKLKVASDKTINKVLSNNCVSEERDYIDKKTVRFWEGIRFKKRYSGQDCHGFSTHIGKKKSPRESKKGDKADKTLSKYSRHEEDEA